MIEEIPGHVERLRSVQTVRQAVLVQIAFPDRPSERSVTVEALSIEGVEVKCERTVRFVVQTS